MTAPHTVLLEHCAPQPWTNGGGLTRELLTWPPNQSPAVAQAAWALRVSVADIESDGPFSRFEGIDRRFAVLEGAGVELTIGGRSRQIRRSDPPIGFGGEVQTNCRLLDGRTRDLNLMVRNSAGRPILSSAYTGAGFGGGLAWRAVFAWSPAVIEMEGNGRRIEVAAGALLWSDRAEPPWHLLEGKQVYWLGLRTP